MIANLHNISNSTLYYSYAGHPPVLARRSGGRWLPLILETPGQANLPLGVLGSVRYDEGQALVQSGNRFLLYISNSFSPNSSSDFGFAASHVGSKVFIELPRPSKCNHPKEGCVYV